MKFRIEHEIQDRMRIHMAQAHMSYAQADILAYYLQTQDMVLQVKVCDRTADVSISYQGDREELLKSIQRFHYEDVEVPEGVLETSGREMNSRYQEKLIGQVISHYAKKWFLSAPLQYCYLGYRAVKYIWHGLKVLAKGKIEVPVLDATAIGVSLIRGDFKTISSIPFDGVVSEGQGMVNQASLTGESVPIRKTWENESVVYAGTVVEEGELTIKVTQVGGSSRFEKIVTMIEESEKLKSNVEGRAAHLADRLVPYSLGGTIITYLLTRNVTKALSILMVDFSCALKLAMPISVLSAIREAGQHHITVKGGKYLEAVAEADTIVFDKTGTLTKAQPSVAKVIPFEDRTEDDLLRIAACLEEHFPHSMANAVVQAAKEKGLEHEEMHSKVDYIVAHGIASSINGKRVIIGSSHFVFEDEGCRIPEGKQTLFDELPQEYSHLYLAIDDILSCVICIEDPLRKEAKMVIHELKQQGFKNIVMMTGDSERTAAAIAREVGVDQYYAEVLPEDKARFVSEEQAKGRKVIMIGDGINDTLALSTADVGIAISEGAGIAREIADITISCDDLYQLVVLRMLSKRLMKRIRKNFRTIVGFNGLLIGLGVGGVLQPTTSALLHNGSTLAIGMSCMTNLLD